MMNLEKFRTTTNENMDTFMYLYFEQRYVQINTQTETIM